MGRLALKVKKRIQQSVYYNKKGHKGDFLKKWADTIKAYGITKIDGRIIGDASIFGKQGAPGGWSCSDMGNYYGAAPSGLNIYDNILELDCFRT